MSTISRSRPHAETHATVRALCCPAPRAAVGVVPPNELLGLRRGDLDFRTHRFRIERGWVNGHVGPPKTAASVRDVPMLGPVEAALCKTLAQRAGVRDRRMYQCKHTFISMALSEGQPHPLGLERHRRVARDHQQAL